MPLPVMHTLDALLYVLGDFAEGEVSLGSRVAQQYSCMTFCVGK